MKLCEMVHGVCYKVLAGGSKKGVVRDNSLLIIGVISGALEDKLYPKTYLPGGVPDSLRKRDYELEILPTRENLEQLVHNHMYDDAISLLEKMKNNYLLAKEPVP